jgi:hypothetical protein
MSAKSAAPVLGSVAAMLALAGTLAVVQLSQSPQPAPTRQVELVQPAAQTVTVTPSPTTTAAPTATAVAPKPAPVKQAPKVESSPKATTDAAPVQQEAVVPKSEPAQTTPAPVETGSEAAARGNIIKPPPGTLAPNSTNGTPEPK